MPVTNTPSKIIYTGNGATSFPIPFLFFDNSHIRVVLTENERDTELTSNFRVEQSDGGANLIYPLDGPPLDSNQRLTIYRWVPVEQLIELTNQGGYYPEVVERALDLGAMIDQQQEEEASRTVKLPISRQGDTNDLANALLAARTEAVDAAARAEAAALDVDAIEEAARRVAVDASTANQAAAAIAAQAQAVQTAAETVAAVRDQVNVSASSAVNAAATAAAITAGVSRLADFLKVLDYGEIADATDPEPGTVFDFGELTHA